jgi:hypothetical protein
MLGPLRCCFGGGRWHSDSARLGSRLLLFGVRRATLALLFVDDGLLSFRSGGGAMVPSRGESNDLLLGIVFPGAGHSFTGRLWALAFDAIVMALALEGATGTSATQGLLS